MSKLRFISEAIFLLLFGFLLWQGRLQVWVLFWLAGIVTSLLFSRFYCGWACPMDSLMRIQSWIYEKLNLSRYGVERKLFVSILRALLLIIFLAGMVAVRGFGLRLNSILMLVALGVLVSFFLQENFWHRVCPHGTVLKYSSKPARYSMDIAEDDCTGCGLCQEACPNEAITTRKDSKIRVIDGEECLVCFDCQKVCPVEAVQYGKI